MKAWQARIRWQAQTSAWIGGSEAAEDASPEGVGDGSAAFPIEREPVYNEEWSG